MAARNPPLYLQAGSHPATNDRLLFEAIMAPPPAVVSGAGYGVVGPGDMAVTQNGTPNMSVNIAAGKAFVDGTENANQGAYLCVNDGTVNLAISASSPTNPRKDLVVAKVQDAEWSGATNAWSLAVVTGTPAASPAEPAVPANAIVLALVDVAANATSITNANITDRRRRAVTLGGIVVCTSTTRPTTGLYEGLFIYETDTDRVLLYTGATWVQVGINFDPPHCELWNNPSGTHTASGSWQAIAFNTENVDPQGMHDNVTNNSRITITVPGIYIVAGGLEWAPNGTGRRGVGIRANGSGTNGPNFGYAVKDTQANAVSSEICRACKLPAGYVELVGFQSSGGNLTINSLPEWMPYFTATYVGRGN